MHIAQRSLSIMRGFLKRYGPSHTKRVLWDKEFSEGHWDFIDNTIGDCVYQHIESYSRNGGILDLGCGPGNTANELAPHAYKMYVGVDISNSALSKARKRSEENDRANKNKFELGDFISYRPRQAFDVILFRESMYHVALPKVKGMLLRYAHFLTDNGVFIVRMVIRRQDGKNKYRLNAMIDIIENNFDIIEKRQYGEPGPTVIVFRPGVNTKPFHRTQKEFKQ